MKNFILLFCLLSTSVFFAKDRRESYADAVAIDKEKGEPLILVFTGSCRCESSIKLDKKVMQLDELKECYMPFMANFPRKIAHKLSANFATKNDKLAEKCSRNGYLQLVGVLANSDVVGTTGYTKDTLLTYIAYLNIL